MAIVVGERIATKEDIKDLVREIQDVNKEIQDVRKEMNELEYRLIFKLGTVIVVVVGLATTLGKLI